MLHEKHVLSQSVHKIMDAVHVSYINNKLYTSMQTLTSFLVYLSINTLDFKAIKFILLRIC